MATDTGAKAGKPAARAAAKPAVAMPGAPGPMRYWLLLQGDVLDKVDSDGPPDLTTEPGERRKQILGGFATKEAQEAAYQRLLPNARGVAGKGEAR
jgi:hypothetical protein